jgi:2-amino-4-hydroxy-6-hydroxymethyldihydropteridine diphosphokinase
MKEVFLSLGGNIGDVKETFRQALRLIGKLSQIQNMRVSSLYRTSPVGDQAVPEYTNCVVRFDCGLPLRELFYSIQEIEKTFGRVRSKQYAPRSLDIDILFFGSDEVHEKDLVIPHPRLQERLFVLVPLFELTKKVGKLDVEREIKKVLKVSNDQVQLLEDRRWNL